MPEKPASRDQRTRGPPPAPARSPETRLYRLEINGGIPRQLLLPAAPSALSAYPPIAEALQTPGQILVCGQDRRARLTTQHFVHWLARRHPRLAARVVGLLTIDNLGPSLESILAKARGFHANPHPA